MTFDEIRSLALGFQPAQVLLTALDLGLFELLAGGGRRADEAAAALGLEPRATEIVANALVALGLLECAESRYANAEPASRFLVRGSLDYRGEILRHIHASWEDWAELESTWRTGVPSLRRKTQQLPSSPEGLRHFILGMENMTRELAPLLAERLPLEGCRKALDLGGGPGNYALAFARRWPGLEVTHFDLPPTSAIAREFLAGQAAADRISFREGDFLTAPLGGGYDLVWASQVVHMFGKADVRRLFGRVAEALAPGGWLAVHDQFLDEGKTSPRAAALFGVHMLAVTEGGRTYSAEETQEWLQQAGLASEGEIDYGGPSRVVLARKPSSA